MAKARRRLQDLYVVGEMVEFDDGGGDPISVWVQKLNPLQHDKAVKRANARRAAVKASFRAGDDQYADIEEEVSDLTVDDMLDLLADDHTARRTQAIEAELASEDEWSNDDYYGGLIEAWSDGLNEKYHEDQEDPEAQRVFAELKRFNAEVDKRLEAEIDDLRASYEDRPEEDLRKLLIDKFFETRASVAWMAEFRRCEVWLSVFEENKRTPYFQDRDEVDMLSSAVYTRLAATYRDLSVDPVEGKD